MRGIYLHLSEYQLLQKASVSDFGITHSVIKRGDYSVAIISPLITESQATKQQVA
jgi:hypothetical protein